MSNQIRSEIERMRAEGRSDGEIMAAFRNELQPPQADVTHLRGEDLYVGSVVKTWFAPNGTEVLECKPYTGPLDCFKGARILTFRSRTPSGRTPMTVCADDLFPVAQIA